MNKIHLIDCEFIKFAHFFWIVSLTSEPGKIRIKDCLIKGFSQINKLSGPVSIAYFYKKMANIEFIDFYFLNNYPLASIVMLNEKSLLYENILLQNITMEGVYQSKSND